MSPQPHRPPCPLPQVLEKESAWTIDPFQILNMLFTKFVERLKESIERKMLTMTKKWKLTPKSKAASMRGEGGREEYVVCLVRAGMVVPDTFP
jgi:hypothetical protein